MKNADDMAARALEVASTALGRMEQHERECLATRQEIKTGMARLHARMDKNHLGDPRGCCNGRVGVVRRKNWNVGEYA